MFEHAGATLYYDDEGHGPPVLLIAPGGLRSENSRWLDMPYNPRHHLAGTHRLIGMDQRNAGRSVGPVDIERAWSAYTDDQLALLDHLDIERCHVLGMCIGGPYILGLLKAAPDRFDKVVMLQPVGLTDENRPMFEAGTAEWAAERDLGLSDGEQATFTRNMWHRPFVGTVSEDEVAAMPHDMLVMMGNDAFHPSETSRRIVELAPNATLVERWKEPEHLDATVTAIAAHLA